MPKVYNFKNNDAPKDAVRIDRASIWGNHYTHLPRVAAKNPDLILVSSREEAVAKYEEYILASSELRGRLDELRGKDLICWCDPLPCHGHILLRLANRDVGLQAIAWTGHRELTQAQEQNASVLIREYLTNFKNMDKIVMLVGMAGGIDQMVAKACIELGVTFTACIPHPQYRYEYGMIGHWFDPDEYNAILRHARRRMYIRGSTDQVLAAEASDRELRSTRHLAVCVRDEYVPWDWRMNFKRNEYMIDKSMFLVACSYLGDEAFDPKGPRIKGGTSSAIRYALKVSKHVVRLKI